MKVLLVCGSPRRNGCTKRALEEAEKVLNGEGVETDTYFVDINTVGCRACRACAKLGKCIVDDAVNEFTKLAENYDGFIFGSPVHYASVSGIMNSFMDRVFYSSQPGVFDRKPAAAVASARRAGTTATLDQLHKYFFLKQMPIVTSTYWNMVHGGSREEVEEDAEGLQTMRNLGRNMAYMLKLIELGKREGVKQPQTERGARTNFIR